MFERNRKTDEKGNTLEGKKEGVEVCRRSNKVTSFSKRKRLVGIAECKHMLPLISGRPPPIMRPTATNPIIRDTRNDLLLRQAVTRAARVDTH